VPERADPAPDKIKSRRRLPLRYLALLRVTAPAITWSCPLVASRHWLSGAECPISQSV